MPSITSQNLFSRVTTDVLMRKVERIDPTKYQKSILQVSDQQARDKEYEKSIIYLRTYIASLQAKLNTVVEELNNSYDTMLSEMLYKKADSKDTSKILNKVANATLTDSCSNTSEYNLRDLEITPYDKNVRFYKYNSLFASKGLDLSNYYDYGQTNNTSIARAYYEKSDPAASSPSTYHELGASVFGTLDYLWKWDLDRVNATYATTKDIFIDADGNLHVPPNDPRLGSAGVVADESLSIIGIGANITANTLQVNVTDLQPNRGVFLPGEEKAVEQVEVLKTTGEEKNPLANWITTYEGSGSQYISNSANYIRNNYTPDTINPNAAGLLPEWEGINQWGVDDTPPILNNALQDGMPFVGTPEATGAGYIGGAGYVPTSATNPIPQAEYSTTSTAGYQSGRSIHFGNIRPTTYNDIVYAAHSTYYFRPDMINEHFNGDVGNTGSSLTNTNDPGWLVTGNTGLIKSNTSYDTGLPYDTAPIPGYVNGGSVSPLPRNVLDMSYSNTASNGSVEVKTATFNLSEFEDVNIKAKQYYNVSPYGSKMIADIVDFVDYGDHDLDLGQIEQSLPSVQLVLNETGTGSNVFQSSLSAQTSTLTFRGYDHDPLTGVYLTKPKPITNNQFTDINFNIALGTANMGLDFQMNEQPNRAGQIVNYFTPGNIYGDPTFYPAGTVLGSWPGSGQLANLNAAVGAHGWGWVIANPAGVAVAGEMTEQVDFRRGFEAYDTGTTITRPYGSGPITLDGAGSQASTWPHPMPGILVDPSYPGLYTPPASGNNAYRATNDAATATRWQIDDIQMNALGFSRGEMISPPLDLSKMESGTLEFMDRIETSDDKIEHKEIYYSFDYNENTPSSATWIKLRDKNEVNSQDWTKNTLDIPCSGGKDNVRVKFVFDTRKNTKARSNGLNNFAKNTDQDGWNLDNIRVYGTKVNPSDFIYYRQELDSEFVTGMGPRDVNMTNVNTGFVAPWTNFTQTVTPNGTLTNVPSAVTQTSSDSLVFSNTPISTVVPAVNLSLTNSIANTTGVVNQNLTTGPATSHTISMHAGTGSVDNGTGGTSTSTLPIGSILMDPNTGLPLSTTSTSTVSISGTSPVGASGSVTYNPLTGSISVTSDAGALNIILDYLAPFQVYSPAFFGPISGSTSSSPHTFTYTLPGKALDPTPYLNGSFSSVSTSGNTVSITVPADDWMSGTLPYLAPVALPNRTLNWDITAGVTATAGNTYSIDFVAQNVQDVTNSASNILTGTDPWSNYVDANGNPVSTIPVAITMNPEINVPASNFSTVTPPKSVVTIPMDLTGLNSASVLFNYTGVDAGSTTRTLEVLNSSGSIIKTLSYPAVGGTTPSNVNVDLSAFVGMSGLQLRFTTQSVSGERTDNSSNVGVWNITDLALSTKVPPISHYTSSRTSGVYHLSAADTNTKFSFDYIATDDSLANIGRKVTMYTSDNGTTWDSGAVVLSDPPATGIVATSGPIPVPAGKYIKFAYDTTIDLPDGVNLPVISNLFSINNAKMERYAGENYNQVESVNFAQNVNRPNISFDSRRSNIEGKYTVVNDRTQISNSDFPMFSNTLLSYVEQDPVKLQAQKKDTYAEWIGNDNNTPARILSINYGYVNPQTNKNPIYVLSSDGLNQYYETDVNGNLAHMYVDDALAINTAKMTKTTTLTQINTDKTGWVNASVNGATGGIFLPYIAGTKFDEGNGTYRNMTVWGKKTFLIDPTSISSPTLNISSNDDSYLYVNGYNVKSTAYNVHTNGASPTVGTNPSDYFSMIDTSDYIQNEYVLINGVIGQIDYTAGAGGPAPVAGELKVLWDHTPLSNAEKEALLTIDRFDVATGKAPATVYHANTAKDRLGNVIKIAAPGGAVGAKSLVLNSVDMLSTGQTIYVNNQPIVISSVNISTNTITFKSGLLNPANVNSPIFTGFVDASASANTTASTVAPNTTSVSGGRTVLNTNSMSATSSFNVQALLRSTGFNTIGVKATEDRGVNEGFKITATGMKALGDTFSPTGGSSGINTDSTWAVKTSPNGYDGTNPYYDGISWTNETAPPLSAQEIIDLFKTEKQTKSEITLHFSNQNANGVGKISQIKNIEVTATGEPTIQTFKTTNYSTDINNTTADSNIVTQMTKGYINGIEQNGGQQSLIFNAGTNLGYSTALDGKADINLFFNKDDNIVNDATLNVKVDYYEDSNGDGSITGAEATTLKTRYIGMQDLRDNSAINSLSTAPAPAITGLIDRYKYVSSTGAGIQGTNTITVASAVDFKVGDNVKVDIGGGKQSFSITAITGNTLTLSSNILLNSGAATVNTYNILSDVNATIAQSMYEGTSYVVSGNTTVNSQYLVASKGRNGGADAGAGNENKIAKRIKQILDGEEFQEMLKYGLLDGVYLAATATDNRGDQIVGKLILDWDWRRKRIAVKQGSFSAIYKS